MEKLLLLVDDEPSILLALKRLFRRTDYTVLTANCGYQALDIIREHPVAILISDYSMPDLSGADLLAMAKSIRPETYAVILSGNNDQQSVIRSINDGGAAKFITKPWVEQELLDTVDAAYQSWLEQRFSLQIPGLLNQKSYLQTLHKLLGNPYLTDYVLLYLELQNLPAFRQQLSMAGERDLFKQLVDGLEANGTPGTTIALMDDGRLSALIKLPEKDAQPELLINNLITTFPALLSFDEHQFPVRFHIGYAVSNHLCHSAEQLLKNASIALRHSTNSPSPHKNIPSSHPRKARVVHFEQGMETDSTRDLAISSHLHHAMARDEFSVYYQPKIKLSDYSVCGAEALLRWNNPVLGSISPTRFIPIAEQYGLINDIGDWVLNIASGQWVATQPVWQQLVASGATVSVNVSSIQLTDPRFISRFAAAVNASGIKPSLLELEVTESAVIHDLDSAVALLENIRELGVKISIDDFGTGYSSLSYLNRLPLDIIKIDRSFVQPMLKDSNSLDLIKNMIRMGKDLGLEIVAEGVEEAAQLEILADFGCDVIQGFYFSEPLPGREFEEYIEQHLNQTWLLKAG